MSKFTHDIKKWVKSNLQVNLIILAVVAIALTLSADVEHSPVLHQGVRSPANKNFFKV
jgi:hypothetical protein